MLSTAHTSRCVFGHGLLRQDWHACTIHSSFRIRVPVVRDIRDKKLSLHCWLQSKPNAIDAIDTVLFKCDKKCKLLSTVTRLFCSIPTRPIVYALFTILPRALGTEVFFAVGPISTLGLVGDSGRTVRSLSAASETSHLPNARRGHSIHPGGRSGTYFQGA